MPQDSTDRIVSLTLDMSRHMRKRMCDFADNHKGPSMLQLHAMIVIQEHEGMTMKEFAKQLQITGPSATSFINRLVKQQLVKRIADRTNRKLVRLKLTPKAATVLKVAMLQRKKFLSHLLSLLTETDRRDFLRILDSLLAALKSLPQT